MTVRIVLTVTLETADPAVVDDHAAGLRDVLETFLAFAPCKSAVSVETSGRPATQQRPSLTGAHHA